MRKVLNEAVRAADRDSQGGVSGSASSVSTPGCMILHGYLRLGTLCNTWVTDRMSAVHMGSIQHLSLCNIAHRFHASGAGLYRDVLTNSSGVRRTICL
ncbi:hypothetical protein ACN38_g1879 [Penicillium nordicum]|uniref:Uncharacterized protein n=1 Tax=Penicillium nordicum TaxID=229535 RepID=A0A0M9WJI7_9EURO|nr:hypothetical protein ACN38_g1879 [Penicillium nordicum]